MENFILSKFYFVKEEAKNKFKKVMTEKNGETNIVAILFIIIIVIGLAIIFRDRLTSLINSLFDQIEDDVKTI